MIIEILCQQSLYLDGSIKLHLHSLLFGRAPMANILKSESFNDTSAPVVVSFSSRGPNPIAPDILKVILIRPS